MSDNVNSRSNNAKGGTAGPSRRSLLNGNALVRYAVTLLIAGVLVFLCLLALGCFSDQRTAQYAVDGGLVVGTSGSITMSESAAYFVLSGTASAEAVLASEQRDAILLLTRTRILADAFFAAGVLVFGFGGIIFVAQEGAFDAVAYAVRQFGLLFQLGRKWGSGHESYREYKERVAKRPKNKFAHLMVVGALLLAAAFVFVRIFVRRANFL